MLTQSLRCGVLAAACSLIGTASLHALQIVFDYTHDIADGGDFFGNNPTAKAALDQAASDISSAITTTLGAITTDPIVGSFGSSSYTINPKFTYSNPVTGAAVELTNTTLGSDVFRIYVGTRNLTGSTLGTGGPGGVGFSTSGGGFENEWVQTVASAESQFNTQYQRSGGPTMFSFLNRSSTLGSTMANYDLFFGAAIGNLWFDVDSDNDGFTDDNSTLADYWHFDHTTDVEAGKNDFYSVALHEILHSLGIGTAESWDDLIANGTDWTGAAAIEENGTGEDLIEPGQGHIAADTMSIILSDSSVQEVVMDPNITVGTRKGLTTLDLAFLQDIGWSVVPEPRAYALALGLFALALVRYRKNIRRV